MNVEEYTQHQLEEEGVFRAFPVAWTVVEKESGSVGIRFQFAIRHKWWGKEQGWSQDWPPGFFVYGEAWVVRRKDKGGGINQTTVENLGKCGLWNGDFDALQGPVPSVFVLLDIGFETYEGKTSIKTKWINPDAAEPTARGGFAPADPDVLSTLRARFQSQTRAIAGGAPAGTAPAPPNVPALPPMPTPGPTPAPTPGPTPAPVQAAPAQAPPAVAPAPQPAPVAPPVAQPPQPAPAPQAAPPAIQPPQVAPPVQPPPVVASSQAFIAPPATGAPDDPVDPDDTPF